MYVLVSKLEKFDESVAAALFLDACRQYPLAGYIVVDTVSGLIWNGVDFVPEGDTRRLEIFRKRKFAESILKKVNKRPGVYKLRGSTAALAICLREDPEFAVGPKYESLKARFEEFLA